jgi:hypothetical protein
MSQSRSSLLKLEEVIPRAEGANLMWPFGVRERLEGRETQVIGWRNETGERLRGRGSVPLDGDSLADRAMQLLNSLWWQIRSKRVESGGRHSATDVATNGVGIQQLGGGECRTNAHIASEVDIRHHGDVLDVVGSGQAIKRTPDRVGQALGCP